MKLITDTDYCPVRNFDDVCSLCNCECISGETLTDDCPLIRNGGIPLPKGHGRLIEEPTETDISNTVGGNNDFAECIRDSVKAVFDNATTIVEADKESDNE